MKRFLELMLALGLGTACFAKAVGTDEKIFSIHSLDEKFHQLMQVHGEPKPVFKKQVKAVQVGETEVFWAMNVTNNQPVQVQAELKLVGKNCYIYLELGMEDRASLETLTKIANVFDNEIYPTNHKFFGSENKPGVDFDPRITLLFLDIQDGWEPGKGYVAGYFSPLDQYSTSIFQFSNEREIFYMDVNPADTKAKDYLGVLAHEFQHMIHYNYDKKEQLWLNEAMSQVAFYVNNFGHAPQILSFITAPDTQIDEFNNGLDDYGSVYLFLYYLATKVIGDLEKTAPIFKDIVASPLKGLESVQSVLKTHGVNTDVNQILFDWLLANYINDPSLDKGQYGYDNTLVMKVQPTAVHSLKALPDTIEGEVNLHSADFVLLTQDLRFLPVNPTLADKIRIFSDYPAKLRWNINQGVLPPEKFIPADAIVNGTFVEMNTKEENGRHFIEVGPFYRGGVQVTGLNYEIVSENAKIAGKIPVFSFQTLREQPGNLLKITFDGDEKSLFSGAKVLKLKTFTVFKDGKKELTEIALNEKNDASFSVDLGKIAEITLIPMSVEGKKSLKYSVRFDRSSQRELSLIDEWASSSELFMEKLKTTPGMLESFKNDWDRLPKTTQSELGEDFRTFLRQFQFDLLGQDEKSSLPVNTSFNVPVAPKAEDSDDSHDNLPFLLKKAGEGVHALSHLQIDPKFLEGQILQTWKLLEIARGFPHLPLPDGLAFVDYETKSIEDLLKNWEKTGTYKHHEPLRRIALAQSMILSTYNEGLVMAEDAALCLMDLVTFFMQTKAAVSTLLSPIIEKGGVVGELAEKLKKKIHAKIVQILGRVIGLASAKLPSPYNTIVPIASSVLTAVYTRIFDLEIEGDNNGWIKPFAMKTMGKYALMSVPKIGIVALGNPSVSLVAKEAAKLDTTYTTEDAADDARARLQPILDEILFSHDATTKKREYAKISKYIAQLSAMTSTFDPTVISKVVGLVSTVAGTGMLAHSIYDSTKTLYSIPKRVPSLVKASFRPFEKDTLESIDEELRLENIENARLLEENFRVANSDYLRVLTSLDGDFNSHQTLRQVMNSEEKATLAMNQQVLMLLGNHGLDEELNAKISQNEIKNAQLQIALLLEDKKEAARLAKEISVSTKELSEVIISRNSKGKSTPAVSASVISVEVTGNRYKIQFKLQKIGDPSQIQARIMPSEGVDVDKNIVIIRSDFVVEGNLKDAAKEPVIQVSFEGKGFMQIPVTVCF